MFICKFIATNSNDNTLVYNSLWWTFKILSTTALELLYMHNQPLKQIPLWQKAIEYTFPKYTQRKSMAILLIHELRMIFFLTYPIAIMDTNHLVRSQIIITGIFFFRALMQMMWKPYTICPEFIHSNDISDITYAHNCSILVLLWFEITFLEYVMTSKWTDILLYALI